MESYRHYLGWDGWRDMTDLTRDQLLVICKDVCPHCKADAPLRKREDTLEWVHDWPNKHAFCLAHHLRTKHESVLNG